MQADLADTISISVQEADDFASAVVDQVGATPWECLFRCPMVNMVELAYQPPALAPIVAHAATHPTAAKVIISIDAEDGARAELEEQGRK